MTDVILELDSLIFRRCGQWDWTVVLLSSNAVLPTSPLNFVIYFVKYLRYTCVLVHRLKVSGTALAQLHLGSDNGHLWKVVTG
jgi:hypothetical protein